MTCQQLGVLFTQPILSGVKWPIKRTPDTIYIKGLIYTLAANGVTKIPVDLTGWIIQIPIYDQDGAVLFLFSSNDLNQYITIIPGADQNPNFIIEVPNSDFIAVFTEDGDYNTEFITTDSLARVKTRWEGIAYIGKGTL